MRLSSAQLLATLLCTACTQAGPAGPAAISDGLVVTAGDPDGWVIELTGATAGVQFVAGPAPAPAGAGSLQLTTGADGDGGAQLRHGGYAGRPLSTLSRLTYATYVAKNDSCQAPYLVLTVDNDGDGSADDRLFFEPCYQTGGYGGEPVPNQGSVTRGAWQRWDALAGGWWPASGGTPGPPLVTIASYLGAHPGATIVNAAGGKGGVRLAAGFGAPVWNDFIGYADDLSIAFGSNATSYDFEPTPGRFRAVPFEFDPGGTGIVSSGWIRRLGLPDAFGAGRFGLILSKNGPTATNAAAGATITGAAGIVLSELGFDVRNGGHCGAGAPRYNVVTMDGVMHFFGCTYGLHTAATPAPGWSRVRFAPGDAFPPVPAGGVVRSISIVFDEGVDTGPDFSGVVILDNLDINGTLITRGGWTRPAGPMAVAVTGDSNEMAGSAGLDE